MARRSTCSTSTGLSLELSQTLAGAGHRLPYRQAGGCIIDEGRCATPKHGSDSGAASGGIGALGLWTGGVVYVALGVVVFATLVTRGEARSSTQADRDASTKTAIAVLCLLFVLCGGGIAWCLYLECNPVAWKTRLIMYLVLAMSCGIELGCCHHQVFQTWMIPLLLVVNAWSSLDAIMRFPVLHTFDSMFTLKQVLLLGAKVTLYVAGITSFSTNKLTFVSLMFINVVGLPLMYILALPLDDVPDESAALRGIVDVDLAWRLAGLFTDPKERRECMLHCKSRAREGTAALARRVPASVQGALCRADPQLHRMLHKTTRDV